MLFLGEVTQVLVEGPGLDLLKFSAYLRRLGPIVYLSLLKMLLLAFVFDELTRAVFT